MKNTIQQKIIHDTKRPRSDTFKRLDHQLNMTFFLVISKLL